MKLWLDDVRDPVRFGYLGFHWVETAQDAIAQLKTGEVTFASLDHDLTPQQTLGGIRGVISEDDAMSGYDVTHWLSQNPAFWPENGVQVHSANPAGKQRMEQVIMRHYGRVWPVNIFRKK